MRRVYLEKINCSFFFFFFGEPKNFMAFEIYSENHFANNTYFEKIKGKEFLEKEVDRKTLWVSKEREFEFFFKESHDFYDKISRKVVLF